MPRFEQTRGPTVVAAVLLAIAASTAAQGTASVDCADITYLTRQAATGFPALRRLESAGPGAHESGFTLEGAHHCAVLEDAQKRSFRCRWDHPLGSPDAHSAFRALVERVRRCFDGEAVEHVDPPVNHPDSFVAHYFQLEQGGVSVSLKNKSARRRTFVTLGVDGAPAPR